MRLIDANALDPVPWEEKADAVKAIREAPTIDAVPVVRCQECNYRSDNTYQGNYLCGRKMLGIVRPSDFCSFGERKDSD